jgi:hypothetical protein
MIGVTILRVVQQKSIQGIDNKGHNHSTTLQYINMKYILNHKGLVYKLNHPTIEENLTSKCPSSPPSLHLIVSRTMSSNKLKL